jgi:hypothetical protein
MSTDQVAYYDPSLALFVIFKAHHDGSMALEAATPSIVTVLGTNLPRRYQL